MGAVRQLSVLPIVGAMVLGLALHNCGVRSSGNCSEKATCASPDGSTGILADDALREASSEEEGASPDAASELPTGEDAGVADRPDNDAADENVGSSDGSDDVSSEPMPGRDGAEDVGSEAVSGGDVVSKDAVGPTDGTTGDACAASACTNTCVPYFLQCCKSDGTCGCALLFPPGPCQ
jgi:hypothetical protein